MAWFKSEIDAAINEKVASEIAKHMRKIRVLQEQAWSQGYQACLEGRQEFQNPFRPESSDDAVPDRATLG